MQTIRIGHPPAADAAFTFHAITGGKVTIGDAAIEPVIEDIESLNRRARSGELEVTVISAASYALVADRYRLTEAGASMARRSGPVLVAREPIDAREIPDRVVAIPGSHTTASLLLRLYVPEEPALIEVAFDRIPQAVIDGQAELGLLIHGAELTHPSLRLVPVLDLGEAWRRDTSLPLPLGVTVVRRDLGEETQRRISRALRASIAWAHTNVDEALEYAMRFGRGLDRETCRRLVSRYVNDAMVSLGAEGRAALTRLYAEAHRRGLIAAIPPLDPI